MSLSASQSQLALIYSRAQAGIDAPLVSVEVHLSNGLPSFSLVGLPEAAVRESKERVRSAILNAGFNMPAQRITVNLAPADLPKEGSRFDLAIAIGILTASAQLNADSTQAREFIGELSLAGQLRPVPAALNSAIACKQARRALFCPQDNATELSVLPNATIYTASSLLELCQQLNTEIPLQALNYQKPPSSADELPLLNQVIGQAAAKRALCVAACGNHNLLLHGPPGCGKSLLAKCLPGLLPPLNEAQALEVAAIYSSAKQGKLPTWRQAPFRSPHHSASLAALVGGGPRPLPGEVSLAHHGVLFLDELSEFPRTVLDALRQPLEDGTISIARVQQQLNYPARCLLIGALNPCPCGQLGNPQQSCRCSPSQIQRYQSRLSGPLLDRIDLQIHMLPLARGQWQHSHSDYDPSPLREKIARCRQQQLQRQGKFNSALSPSELQQYAPLSPELSELLDDALERLSLSTRALHRITKVARTLADMNQCADIQQPHILEALSYRQPLSQINGGCS